MKPDYKNWIPKGMLFSLIAGTVLALCSLNKELPKYGKNVQLIYGGGSIEKN